MSIRRRVSAAVALVAIVGFVGVGLALVVGAGALALGITLVEDLGGGGRTSLRAPGVALALGAELITAALLVGWRVGTSRSAEEEDREPVAG
ncbi:MAG TPA: hypothetical protein VHN78_14170 [Chloroflexota bacterium]|nr:hypothetical protein [Chloroflexota bacterium]